MFISIISVAFSAVIAIVMAIFDFGVWSLVAYQVVNSLVVTILSLYTTRYKVSFKFSIRSFKHLFSFGVFTTLATVIDTVYENIIVNFFGKNLSIQQAGLLYQAKRIEEVPTQSIATTVTNVSFPILTKLRFESSKFVVECSSIFKMVLLMILPLLACISFFSTPIIRLLFGDQWIDAGPYLNLLIFAGIFKIAETLNRTFIKSTTEVGRLFKFTIIKNVLGIGLLMIFARINVEYILYGYILASFLGYLVNCILLSQVSDWSIGDQFMLFIRIAFPTICFYLIMSLFAHFVSILFIQIIMAFISLSLLYLVLFRLYKINVFSVVKQFVR